MSFSRPSEWDARLCTMTPKSSPDGDIVASTLAVKLGDAASGAVPTPPGARDAKNLGGDTSVFGLDETSGTQAIHALSNMSRGTISGASRVPLIGLQVSGNIYSFYSLSSPTAAYYRKQVINDRRPTHWHTRTHRIDLGRLFPCMTGTSRRYANVSPTRWSNRIHLPAEPIARSPLT